MEIGDGCRLEEIIGVAMVRLGWGRSCTKTSSGGLAFGGGGALVLESSEGLPNTFLGGSSRLGSGVSSVCKSLALLLHLLRDLAILGGLRVLGAGVGRGMQRGLCGRRWSSHGRKAIDGGC